MSDISRYGFDDEYQQLFDMVDRYARENLHELSAKMDDDDWFPKDEYAKLSQLGVLGITLPSELGGAGMDEAAQAMVAHALAKWNPSLSLSYLASDNLCANNLNRHGSDFLREKYLPGFCDGTILGALGMTEPGAGSDALGSMATRARRDGDNYILNGRKLWITNGPEADVVLVYAKTDPEAGNRGISAFLVETGFPGFGVDKKLDKMGYRGSPTGELVFEDCVVPAENLVGEENNGVRVMMSGLDLERALLAAHCVGICERALELSIDWAKNREQFGTAIGNQQLVQRMLAHMYTDTASARNFCYQIIRECEGLTDDQVGRGEIHMRTAASVLLAGGAINRVLDNGMQIHGGMGFMREIEINRLYRCAKILEIGAGTREIRELIVGGELVR
ncbi:acyl-CoA dehydrogenase family protein [Citromicrobium sp. JLT1363]|uniref:acyl-CoA dehydrogenase family protein n=1 Tax=Citromicrobium sp. JLT1363 TaxID=517722 RepID=UPI000225E94E|nr:acyl-CoA dehydrogenase family protein [Citromicrobium sp. JLT1363]